MLMRATVRRCLWGSLSLIHIAPLISATSAMLRRDVSAGDVLSCALVWLTFAFFALKFIDVPWLRWRISRSSVMAFVVACGLAHQDVSSSQGAQALLAETPAAVAASLLCELAIRSRRALPRFLSTLIPGVRCEYRLWFVTCEALSAVPADVMRPQALAGIAIPRGPPRR